MGINADIIAPDVFWKYEETLINNTALGKALSRIVLGSSTGVNIPNLYQIVDGNLCATLWELQGSELWVFDENLLANELITVSEIGIPRDQIAGNEPVSPPTPNGTQPTPAEDASKNYKSKIRCAIAALHTNANAGDITGNEALATDDVVVTAYGETMTSK
ncbi:MAG: hypothetical protein Q9183_006005 [Haloplaca sp. 2 TL-2023]